jgi:hypothetical protein
MAHGEYTSSVMANLELDGLTSHHSAEEPQQCWPWTKLLTTFLPKPRVTPITQPPPESLWSPRAGEMSLKALVVPGGPLACS